LLRPEMMKFYSAWFCPYAQRAWIVLEHHNIDYELVESLIVRKDQDGGHNGYDKNSRLLELNPKGLVPTLEFTPDAMKEMGADQKEMLKVYGNVGVLTDSIFCMEFLNSLGEKEKDLITDSTFLTDVQEFNKDICSVFYSVLMKPTPDEQKKAFDLFCLNVGNFIANVKDEGFYKSAVPTIVDFAVIPWLLRFSIIEYYRPTFSFEQCLGEDRLGKINAYIERMKQLPAIQKTLCKNEEKLMEVYERYASGKATSQVGKAVRNGLNVHDV